AKVMELKKVSSAKLLLGARLPLAMEAKTKSSLPLPAGAVPPQLAALVHSASALVPPVQVKVPPRDTAEGIIPAVAASAAAETRIRVRRFDVLFVIENSLSLGMRCVGALSARSRKSPWTCTYVNYLPQIHKITRKNPIEHTFGKNLPTEARLTRSWEQRKWASKSGRKGYRRPPERQSRP